MNITVRYKYTWSSLALSRMGRTPSMNTAAAKSPNKAPEILKSREWLQKEVNPHFQEMKFSTSSPIRSPKGFRPKPCKKSIWDTEILLHWKHFSLAILQFENKNGRRKFRDKYLWDWHCRHGGGSEADSEESQENLRWSNLFEFHHVNVTKYRYANVTRWQVKKITTWLHFMMQKTYCWADSDSRHQRTWVALKIKALWKSRE